MPPRRGRGRGRSPARPPQVLRDSMAEIGMSSVAQFEASMKLSAKANADASRAYFPPLKPENKPKPSPIMQTENQLVSIYADLIATIRASPMGIEYKKDLHETKFENELKDVKYYFKTSSYQQQIVTNKRSIWDENNCYIISDMLPTELLPRTIINKRNQKENVKKRARMDYNKLDVQSENQMDPNQLNAIANLGIGDQTNPEANAEDREDGDQNDQIVPNAELNEEEEGEQMEGDYDTGFHCDDDEGYVEADSGAEEAIF